MANKTDRTTTLSWENLTEILRKSDLVSRDEEIGEVTLMKPKQILFYFRPKASKEVA